MEFIEKARMTRNVREFKGGTAKFYNTNRETGSVLASSRKKVETQEGKILAFFRDNDGAAFGPSKVATEVFSNNVPLTSVRRGITNLTSLGHLEKTWIMVDGSYGKPENTWTLISKEESK